jgi:hypothetical protein
MTFKMTKNQADVVAFLAPSRPTRARQPAEGDGRGAPARKPAELSLPQPCGPQTSTTCAAPVTTVAGARHFQKLHQPQQFPAVEAHCRMRRPSLWCAHPPALPAASRMSRESRMADAAVHGHGDHHDTRGFFTRWFMSTNHKDIGILYLFTAGVVGLISVAFTVFMRMELQFPGVQHMCLEGARFFADATRECTPNGHLWNVMITYHGVLMMFFVVIPALFGGFGNYFMPLQIGAPDMAFPRLNNLSYWMYVCGVALGVASLLAPGGSDQAGSGVGWVLYPPLSTTEAGYSMDLAIFAVHVSGASSILGAINIITTFLNMRAPGMTLFKVPLFAWSVFITAWLILLSLPVLAGAITMLLMDRNFGTLL